MKCFVSLLFVSACAMAKSMSGFNAKSTLMSGNGYLTADARDGWDAPATTTTFIDQTFQPASYAAAPASGFGFGGGFDLGFPGILNSSLTAILSIVGLSMLVQLITKLVKIPFLSELFSDGARSLSPDNISQMGDYVLQAIQTLQDVYGNDE